MVATLTQTASAASSGRSVSGARDVTISASSRCDLDDSLHGPSKTATPTPAAKAKRTSVKRHATLTPLSSAKTVAVSRPLPVYPYQAKHHHIIGDGVCVMTVDTASGKVTDATMKQSSGNAILDKSTTEAFRQWRFKPRTVSRVRVPISYKPALGVIPTQVFADHVVVYENVESR